MGHVPVARHAADAIDRHSSRITPDDTQSKRGEDDTAMRGIQAAIRGTVGALVGTLAGAFLFSGSALALKPAADEKAKLKACEAQLCGVILNKAPAGGTLACTISKTWEKSKIVNGVKQKKISWTFGDAQCGVDLKVPHDAIIAALTQAKSEFNLQPHTIACVVERDKGTTDVKISMAPKITFKDGKAQKAWLNISKIEAPTIIKGAIWTVSKLEDNFGLFHGQLIKEINTFVHKKCAKRYKPKS
jgi:hypothetical protein